jgi:hypothetical protein
MRSEQYFGSGGFTTARYQITVSIFDNIVDVRLYYGPDQAPYLALSTADTNAFTQFLQHERNYI